MQGVGIASASQTNFPNSPVAQKASIDHCSGTIWREPLIGSDLWGMAFLGVSLDRRLNEMA
jgi:hypothetical protein